MSTTSRRALRHVHASLLALSLLVVALVALAPAPSAQALSRPAGERVVKIAAAQAGTPYAYGARGPRAFDCSGFTSWVYARAGRAIPRTSSAQAAAAHRVRAGQARRGDLVFFTSGGRVYHVGIYAGRHRVWHSPKPGGRVHLARIWTPSHFFGRV